MQSFHVSVVGCKRKMYKVPSYSGGTQVYVCITALHQACFLALICNLSQCGFKLVSARQCIHLVISELNQ